ncbi:MAG: hypothetical protein M3321_05325 [Actinomycetota bacterium]|nr:hypothetical protein [Actinomycetota bacterium]
MDRLLNPPWLLRVALVGLVLFWLFGPGAFRSAVPIWLVFAVALGLELQFFVGGLRGSPASDPPDRGPQAVDRERYGYADDEDEELWDVDLEDDEEEEDVPVGEPRRPLRRFVVGLGVVAGLALLLWFVESRRGWDSLDGTTRARAEARFSAEASRIAGKPVTVRCDESGRHVGAVQHSDGAAVVGGDLAYLTPERCLQLYRLAFEGDTASSQTARAIAVLAHEAWHLRGVGDEGTTECYALQSGVELGRRLGVAEETARRLMRQQLAENALRRGASFEYRVSADCRDGGSLDLDRAGARFP